MTHSRSITDYINDLKKNLKDLPSDERDSILDEIEMHLNDKIDDLMQEGYSQEGATRIVLANFKTPQALSQEYIRENYDEGDPFKHATSLSLINTGIIGLAFLSMSIVKETLDTASLTLGGLLVIFFLIFVFNKNQWKTVEIRALRFIPKILLCILTPTSVLFFWIANKSNGGIVMFSLYYMIIYWLILIVFWIIIKRIIRGVNK